MRGTGGVAPVPLSLDQIVSEVELQGELYLSGILRSCDETVPSVRFCKVRVVEQIEEIGTELNPLRLSKKEVLLQAQIHVCVPRSNHRTLSRAVTEGAWRWI